jgi:hypothetical protein
LEPVNFDRNWMSYCVAFDDGVTISTLRCRDETEGLLWRAT